MPTELSDLDIAIRDGDRAAFASIADRHRRELQVHCYRMVGSLHDAEDMVQETFLRAWANRSTYEGRSSFRAWLYRIATNSCLDLIRTRRRVVPLDARSGERAEVSWLEPFPDSMLPAHDDPAAATIAKETIELAYIAAIQHLPPRQRAVLLLRDAIGWSAKETADLLEFTGPARIGDFKMVPTRCNNQLAAANYVRAPGEETYERLSLDVLRIESGQIAEIVTFPESVFDDFGLPERI
jgi:RNA polymerase sigma-70 factor (ECF subfamily)